MSTPTTTLQTGKSPDPDKETDDSKIEDQKITTGKIAVPGGEIFYKRVSTPAAEKNTPILVIHGGPAVPHDYLLPLSALATEHPIIFYDQLGCGKSDRPSDASLWNLRRFIIEIECLRQALDLDKVILYGHSWGCALILEYTLKDPAGLKGIIFASPLISAELSVQGAIALTYLMGDKDSQTILNAEQKGDFASPDYLDARKKYASLYLCRSMPTPPLLVEAFKGVNEDLRLVLWGKTPRHPNGIIKGFDRIKEFQALSLPILVTCGAYDFPRPASLETLMKDMPNARMQVFEKSSHMSHLEEPAEYLSCVQNFIAEALNPKPKLRLGGIKF